MLIVPFIAQRMDSTLAAFYVHAIPNMLLWVIIYFGIRGKKKPLLKTNIYYKTIIIDI
ncbi:hypothetical protein [Liberiplasma polymorphum]|uniref:hypothetical protein n=1 Tax=Liberiplasma polymorphum TaxID=3374570 RepID=UPI0037750422